MTTYISSDLHFGHNKDFVYQARGFFDMQNHDESIIQQWNCIVRSQDDVYFLGDIGMGRDIDYLVYCVSRLNGTIHWIRGNHDNDRRWETIGKLPHIIQEGYSKQINYKKYRFLLSHYPTLTAPVGSKPFRSSLINLCGHSHIKNKFADWDKYDHYIYHCELDAHNCFPQDLDSIIVDMKEKDNDCKNVPYPGGQHFPY